MHRRQLSAMSKCSGVMRPTEEITRDKSQPCRDRIAYFPNISRTNILQFAQSRRRSIDICLCPSLGKKSLPEEGELRLQRVEQSLQMTLTLFPTTNKRQIRTMCTGTIHCSPSDAHTYYVSQVCTVWMFCFCFSSSISVAFKIDYLQVSF